MSRAIHARCAARKTMPAYPTNLRGSNPGSVRRISRTPRSRRESPLGGATATGRPDEASTPIGTSTGASGGGASAARRRRRRISPAATRLASPPVTTPERRAGGAGRAISGTGEGRGTSRMGRAESESREPRLPIRRLGWSKKTAVLLARAFPSVSVHAGVAFSRLSFLVISPCPAPVSCRSHDRTRYRMSALRP
jgi:hypothetical protein